MKRLMLYGMLLFCASIYAQSATHTQEIKILPVSSLTISGDTNITEFECDYYTAQIKESTPLEYTISANEIIFNKAELHLKNKGFDCGNKAINKDFHALVQSEEYPEIILKLNKISLSSGNMADAKVTICIAGIENNYELPVSIATDNSARFKGTLKLNINDFKLQPPKKLFGMIVVKKDIEIQFDLSIQK